MLFPALSTNPIDVAGAGDSLFSVVSLCLSNGLALSTSAALGTIIAKLQLKH